MHECEVVCEYRQNLHMLILCATCLYDTCLVQDWPPILS